jgi:RNA polymerase sigma factor (sigma-70 family)
MDATRRLDVPTTVTGTHAETTASTSDALAEAARANPALYGELYLRHRDQVFRLVRRHTSDDDEAADLAAGAFERAFRSRASFDPRRGSFVTWLLRIARNHAIDVARRRRPAIGLHLLPDRFHPTTAQAPDEILADADDLAVLRRRVNQLPLLQQEVLALRFGAGLTSAEIGRVIGKREAATQKLISRAITRLKEDSDAQW